MIHCGGAIAALVYVTVEVEIERLVIEGRTSSHASCHTILSLDASCAIVKHDIVDENDILRGNLFPVSKEANLAICANYRVLHRASIGISGSYAPEVVAQNFTTVYCDIPTV